MYLAYATSQPLGDTFPFYIMPKLFIPEIGDTLELVQPWTFDLFNEDRNSTLMAYVGDTRSVAWNWKNGTMVAEQRTLPIGSKLKIDRIFIRKGKEEFSSITFFLVGARTPRSTYDNGFRTVVLPARPVRFWAKLADVNTIEFK
jgi:hypothetical protein